MVKIIFELADGIGINFVFTTVLSGIKGLMTTIRHGQYDHIYLHKKNCIVNVSHLGNY